MNSLKCLSSIAKPHILASKLPTKPEPPNPKLNTTPNLPSSPKLRKHYHNQSLKQEPKQPSIAEIERAVGAGIFRDKDTERDLEEEKTLFDTILSNESSVEKKLRETGEWIMDRSDNTSRSAGKNILMFVFLWAMPMWITAFLIASGIVKLPFNSHVLDDFIL